MSKKVLLSRLKDQWKSYHPIFTVDEASLRKRVDNKWSAFENLAHLGRYHEIFLMRLVRICQEDNPQLGRYNPQKDDDFGVWLNLSTSDLKADLRDLRTSLLEDLFSLEEIEFKRQGVHPTFGALSLTDWLRFFLIHEGHHLYLALVRSR